MLFHQRSQKQGHVPAEVELIKLKKEERLQGEEAEHCCPRAEEDVKQAVCGGKQWSAKGTISPIYEEKKWLWWGLTSTTHLQGDTDGTS